MILQDVQIRFLNQLKQMPADNSRVTWSKPITELETAGLIQRIGKSVYLTESGQNVANNL